MKQIDKNNKIFTSAEFQKDKYKFYLISQNLKCEEVLLYSDEENYVVCRGKVGLPTWIWTKDNISMDIAREIEEVINFYLTEDEKCKFTCKKELYDLLIQDGFDKVNREDYFEMGSFYCKKTKKPKECDGKMDLPTMSDKDILVKYWYDDCIEMNGIEPITIEESTQDIQNKMAGGNLYIWRNNEGKIVSMAGFNETDTEAKIGSVYTPIAERRKGYAVNLVYALTNKLLEKGLTTLLYTDYNYIPSNKAYIKIGYESDGILINFSCSKKRIRKR